MLFEHIITVYNILYAASPLIGLILLISVFFMESNERILALIVGFFMTFIGCVWISPIELGSWGFGIFEYIFAIPFWFSIGLMIGQLILFWSGSFDKKQIPKSSVLLVFYVIILCLTYGYAFRARDKSFTLIQEYLVGKISESELTTKGHHRRQAFNEIVTSQLQLTHISSQVPESHIRFLASRGINVFHCVNTPADLIDELLKTYEANALGQRRPPTELIISLCKNPNLRTEDFIRLAKVDAVGLSWTMVESSTFDEQRCIILRDQLQSLLQKSLDTGASASYSAEEIASRIKMLDEFMARKKSKH